jgi:hypothetical protein
MDLAAVMDEIARRVAAADEDGPLAKRSYGWPNPTASPPAFVVSYPAKIDFDATMQRGNDRAQFPCWALFGLPSERPSRDKLSSFLLLLKSALDGRAAGIWDSARAMDVAVQTVMNDDGTELLAARFTVDVVT